MTYLEEFGKKIDVSGEDSYLRECLDVNAQVFINPFPPNKVPYRLSFTKANFLFSWLFLFGDGKEEAAGQNKYRMPN